MQPFGSYYDCQLSLLRQIRLQGFLSFHILLLVGPNLDRRLICSQTLLLVRGKEVAQLRIEEYFLIRSSLLSLLTATYFGPSIEGSIELIYSARPSQQQALPIAYNLNQKSNKYKSRMGLRQKEAFFITHQAMPGWNTDIAPILQKLSLESIPANQLIPVLLRFHERYCNRFFHHERHRKIDRIDLRELQEIYGKELTNILKGLSLFLLNYKPGLIPLIVSQRNAQNTYSKQDLFYLVTLMFMGLVPQQEYHSSHKMEFNNMNSFGHIFSYSEFKTICIVEYIKDTLKLISHHGSQLERFLIFRAITKQSISDLITKQHFNSKLTKLYIESDNSSIEDFNGELKVDFANKFIGGGCLRDGCVQEEIMFAIRPELYATTLLCQKMEDNEALAFTGFRRYFNHAGYGDTTSFKGKANSYYKFFEDKGVKFYNENIIAVDALKFKKGDMKQFSRQCINREIKKAYTGFKMYDSKLKVITGGWGCGAFNGDFTTKLVIQWIAASMAGKQIVICPFGRSKLLQQTGLVDFLGKLTVSQAYQFLIDAGRMKYQQRIVEDIAFIMVHLLKKSKM